MVRTSYRESDVLPHLADSPPKEIYDLFVLNIALQLFDGVATYQGVRLGWSEANPLLVASFQTLGIGPALLLYKAKACGLLLLLERAPLQIGVFSMRALAAVYAVFSLAPWLAKFLSIGTAIS
jgi:hypothetical protein